MTDSTTYRRWIGHKLVDREGTKIGRIDQIYVDERTGQPTWMTVHTGLIGGRTSFVPLEAASPSGSDLAVPYSKDEVKSAPSTQPGARLDPSEQRTLHEYYERAGSGTAGPSGGTEAQDLSGRDRAADDATTRGGTEVRDLHPSGTADEMAQSAETAPLAEERPRAEAMPGDRPGERPGERMPAGEARTGERMSAGETRPSVETPTADTPGRGRQAAETDVSGNGAAMTRFEEEMRVRTESVEAGRARLRKHVETENVEMKVPVSHEEVRLEREPVAEADRNAVTGEATFSDREVEIVLHEERPVVAKEIVPKERIRLVKETVTEERVISDQLRKEKIDMEGIDQARGEAAQQ